MMDVYNDQVCFKHNPNKKGQYIRCTPKEVRNGQVDLVYSRSLYEESQRNSKNNNADFLIVLKRDPQNANNLVECSAADLEDINVVKFTFCRDIYQKSTKALGERPSLEQKLAYLNSFSTPQIVVTKKSNVAEKVAIYNAKKAGPAQVAVSGLQNRYNKGNMAGQKPSISIQYSSQVVSNAANTGSNPIDINQNNPNNPKKKKLH